MSLFVEDISDCVESGISSVRWGVSGYHDQIPYFMSTFLKGKHVWAMWKWVCGMEQFVGRC